MASWQSYMDEMRKYLQPVNSMYNDLSRSSALTFGSAARHAENAYTGSPTSGAFGNQQGEIWSQRGASLADALAKLKADRNSQLVQMMQMAQQQAQADQSNSMINMLGIGKGIAGMFTGLPGGIMNWQKLLAKG